MQLLLQKLNSLGRTAGRGVDQENIFKKRIDPDGNIKLFTGIFSNPE